MSHCGNKKTISGTTYPQTCTRPKATQAPVSPSTATQPGLTAMDDDGDDDAIAGNCQLHGITVSCFVGNLERLRWTEGSRGTSGINARFTKSGCRLSVANDTVQKEAGLVVGGGGVSWKTSTLIKPASGSSQILAGTIIAVLSARQVSLIDFEDAGRGWDTVVPPGKVRRWLTESQRAKIKSGLSRRWRAAVTFVSLLPYFPDRQRGTAADWLIGGKAGVVLLWAGRWKVMLARALGVVNSHYCVSKGRRKVHGIWQALHLRRPKNSELSSLEGRVNPCRGATSHFPAAPPATLTSLGSPSDDAACNSIHMEGRAEGTAVIQQEIECKVFLAQLFLLCPLIGYQWSFFSLPGFFDI